MKSASRVGKFSLVGALGIGVQLAVLSALMRLRIHYLLATALAVETAVIHNFLWHQRITWSDRTAQNVLLRFLRFHLSNGGISLVGNLLLMRLLAGSCGLPVIVANLLSISTCFAANFFASDRWVFVGEVKTSATCKARSVEDGVQETRVCTSWGLSH